MAAAIDNSDGLLIVEHGHTIHISYFEAHDGTMHPFKIKNEKKNVSRTDKRVHAFSSFFLYFFLFLFDCCCCCCCLFHSKCANGQHNFSIQLDYVCNDIDVFV